MELGIDEFFELKPSLSLKGAGWFQRLKNSSFLRFFFVMSE
ncbi:conserved hypothetical protein [Wolbachia endosymbiont of Drosophila ananassae]|nr:conserved hypothetical protein [Wolbachia endosymbiont of Drosophila ananassae]